MMPSVPLICPTVKWFVGWSASSGSRPHLLGCFDICGSGTGKPQTGTNRHHALALEHPLNYPHLLSADYKSFGGMFDLAELPHLLLVPSYASQEVCVA